MTTPRDILLSEVRKRIESSPKRVYSRADLLGIYYGIRSDWLPPKKITPAKFLDCIIKQIPFPEIVFASSYQKPPKRYSWGKFSLYELALSIRKDAYLSHGTATFLHGLTDREPDTIYVNKEQSFKSPSGSLTQQALSTAFSRKQRRSRYVLRHGKARITLLSGKSTGRLGVQKMQVNQREYWR